MRSATAGGLQLLVDTTPSDAVAIQLWIRAGSADEQPGEEGACHLLEHLVFRGPDGGGSPLAAAVEAEGGEVNAFTSCDHTVFFATVPKPAWPIALDALQSAVFEPDLQPDVVATERQVVLEEIRGVREDAAEDLGAGVRRELYGSHPYGRPITGTDAQVGALRVAAVDSFHRRCFRPGHAALVVSGDIDTDALLSRLRTSTPAEPLPPRPAVDFLQGRTAAWLHREGVPSARFELSWPGPSAGHPDRAALDVLAWCLVSRAGTEDRGAEPLETEVWAPRQEGLITAWAAALPDRVLDDLTEALRAAMGLALGGVGARELREAKTALLAQQHFAGEAVEHRADRIGQGWADQDNPDAFEAWTARLEALSTGDIRRVARRWLGTDFVSIGVLSPEAGLGSDVAAAADHALRRPRPHRVRRGPAAGPRRPTPKVPRARRATIVSETDRGATLVVESRPGTGVVSLQLGLAGGRGIEPASSPGRLDLMADAWTAETPRRSPGALDATLDGIGGDLQAWVDLDGVGWRLDFLAERAGRALALAEELVAPPKFSAPTLAEVKRAARSHLGGRLADAGTVASVLARRRLFGEHAWASPAWGSLEAVKALSVPELTAAWNDHAAAGGAVLSLCGDLDPDAASNWLRALARALPDRAAATTPPLPPSEPGLLEATVPRGRAQIVLAWPGLAAADPELPALEVLTTLLSSQSGPLFEEVRERRGLAYDLDVSHTEGRLGGTLEIRAACDPAQLPALRAALDETLDKLPSRLTDRALASAGRLAAGRRRLDRQHAAVRAEERALAHCQGLPWSTPDDAAESLARIAAQRVRAVCARIIVAERRVESIVRPLHEGNEE